MAGQDLKVKLKVEPYLDPNLLKTLLKKYEKEMNDPSFSDAYRKGAETSYKQLSQVFNEAQKYAVKMLEAQVKQKEEAQRLKEQIGGVAQATDKATGSAQNLRRAWADTYLMLEGFEKMTQLMMSFTHVAAEYEYSLAEVSAITGVTGEKLQALGEDARGLAKTFGGSVLDQLQTYKALLGKLGPEMAQNASALKQMTEVVNVLSKASGESAAQSMQAIVDAGLQLGLIGNDAKENAENFEYIANVLAAGSRVGSAEIPSLTVSILDAGAAAKLAGLDIKELVATLETLGRGGKYFGEAGTALRNFILYTQQADASADKMLKRLGTSSEELGTILRTDGIAGALDRLNEALKNTSNETEKTSLLTKLYNVYNVQSIGILLKNVDYLKKYKREIEGIAEAGRASDDSVWAQAAIRMDTAVDSGLRLKAGVEEVTLSVGEAIGETGHHVAEFAHEMYPLLASVTYGKESLGVFKEGWHAFGGAVDSTKAIMAQAVKGMGKTVTASQIAGKAIKAVGTAWMASPLGKIALIFAAIGAIKVLTKWLGNWSDASGRAEEIQSDFATLQSAETVNKVKQQAVSASQAQIDTYKDATSSLATLKQERDAILAKGDYEGSANDLASKNELITATSGDAERALLSLAQRFPEVAFNANDATGNLEKLEMVQSKLRDQMAELSAQEGALAVQKIGLELDESENQRNIIREQISDVMTDAMSGLKDGGIYGGADWIGEQLFGVGSIRQNVDSFLQPYVEAVYNAKDSNELQTAAQDFVKGFDEYVAKAQEQGYFEGAEGERQAQNVKNKFQEFANAHAIYLQNLSANQEKVTKASLETASKGFRKALATAKDVNAEAERYAEQASKNAGKKITAEQIKAEAMLVDIEALAKSGEFGAFTVGKLAEKYQVGEGFVEGIARNHGVITKEAQLASRKMMDMVNQWSKIKGLSDEATTQAREQYTGALHLYEAEKKRGVLNDEAIADLKEQAEQKREALNVQLKENVEYRNTEFTVNKYVKKMEKAYGLLTDSTSTAKELADKYAEMVATLKDRISYEEALLKIQKETDDIGRKKVALAEADTRMSEILLANRQKEYDLTLSLFEKYTKVDTDALDGLAPEKLQEAMRAYGQALLLAGKAERKSAIARLSQQYGVEFPQSIKRTKEALSSFKGLVKLLEDDYIGLADAQLAVLKSEDALRSARTDAFAEALKEDQKQLEEFQSQLEDLYQSYTEREGFEGLVTYLASLEDMLASMTAKAGDETAENLEKIELLQQLILKLRKEIGKKEEDEQSKKIQRMLKREEDFAKKVMDLYQRTFNFLARAQDEYLGREQEERMKQLDQSYEDVEDAEEAHQRDREAIETEYYEKRKALESYRQGAQLAAEQRFQLEKLIQQKKALEAQLAITTDPQTRERINEQLTTLNQQVFEAGDLMVQGINALGGPMADAFASLFTGNAEAMKDGLREVLGGLAGFLTALLAGLVAKMVITDLLKLNLASPIALALAPAMITGIQGAMNALIEPLMRDMLSFATGGVVTKPTLAMVGDASKFGGDNAEFILRNKQLQAVIGEAVRSNESAVAQAVSGLSDDIASIFPRFVLEGENLRTSVKRVDSRESRRTFRLPS